MIYYDAYNKYYTNNMILNNTIVYFYFLFNIYPVRLHCNYTLVLSCFGNVFFKN